MSKQPKKQDLPTKICPVCNRSFAWRKKWKKNWNEVKYCSEACKSIRKSIDKNSILFLLCFASVHFENGI